MSTDKQPRSIDAKIERSSLGTPEVATDVLPDSGRRRARRRCPRRCISTRCAVSYAHGPPDYNGTEKAARRFIDLVWPLVAAANTQR